MLIRDFVILAMWFSKENLVSKRRSLIEFSLATVTLSFAVYKKLISLYFLEYVTFFI